MTFLSIFFSFPLWLLWFRSQFPPHFRTAVLEKTLESPLASKEVKLVNLKGNQSWILIGRTDAEASIFWPPDANSWLTGKKTLMLGKIEGRRRNDRGWDGCMASLMHWTWTWANFGRWWGTEKSDMLQFMGSWRAGHYLKIEQTAGNLQCYSSLWKRKRQPTPIFLPGEFHGQRSLAGYSPWGRKESDTMKQLTHVLSSVFIILYYGLNVSPQNSYIEALNDGTVFGDMTFKEAMKVKWGPYKKRRGHQGRVCMWGHSKKTTDCKPRKEVSAETNPAGTFILKMCFCCLSHAVCDVLLWSLSRLTHLHTDGW